MRHHHIVVAHIGIGSNLGDREKTIHHAIDLIDLSEGLAVNKTSKLIETQPVGMEEGTPPFINCVIEVRTVLTPQDLLLRLMAIERQLGREHGKKWQPRTIDLDILLYNNQIIRNLQVSTQVNVVGGPAYGIRTGRDENGDAIFNDRPRGVGRNSLRGATHANLNMFTQYTFVFDGQVD